MKRYFMKSDSRVEPKATVGTEVFPCRGSDYGMARDDERMLGEPCRSMTLDKDGGYPFFVVPLSQMEFRD